MIANPLFSTLVCLGSTLMLASTAQAQGLFGLPFFAPYNSQPRFVSPCGPNGCPSNLSTGYVTRTHCSNGVCYSPGSTSMNYAPRGYDMTNRVCGPNGCSTGSCANGACSTTCPNGQCAPRNGIVRPMPYDYGYQTRTQPQPVVSPRDYGANRTNYYYEERPSRVAPPVYQDPRSDFFYGTSRSSQYDTSVVDRTRSTFGNERSPFYP